LSGCADLTEPELRLEVLKLRRRVQKLPTPASSAVCVRFRRASTLTGIKLEPMVKDALIAELKAAGA
jgi:hypothetical protein